MSDESDENGVNDPEIRRFEREIEHQEKQLEMTQELLKEAPELLSKLITECVLPVAQQLNSQQQSAWEPPKRREKPQYDPPDRSWGGFEEGGGPDTESVRDKLDLDGDGGDA